MPTSTARMVRSSSQSITICPARAPRDRPRRLEALRPMGLAERRGSDRCSSRSPPPVSRSRRRWTPQRLRSRPRSALFPRRRRPHRRRSHQSVARTLVTQGRRSYAGGCPPSDSRSIPTSTVPERRSQSIRSSANVRVLGFHPVRGRYEYPGVYQSPLHEHGCRSHRKEGTDRWRFLAHGADALSCY
jgi:hypothetical protein